jgi:hypothetical protein
MSGSRAHRQARRQHEKKIGWNKQTDYHRLYQLVQLKQLDLQENVVQYRDAAKKESRMTAAADSSPSRRHMGKFSG